MTTEEMIAVMQHFANGVEVEWKWCDRMDWKPVYSEPVWNWDTCEYRIKPAEPKKVKMYCYMTGAYLVWRKEGAAPHHSWIRIPSEDKEITLSEDV